MASAASIPRAGWALAVGTAQALTCAGRQYLRGRQLQSCIERRSRTVIPASSPGWVSAECDRKAPYPWLAWLDSVSVCRGRGMDLVVVDWFLAGLMSAGKPARAGPASP